MGLEQDRRRLLADLVQQKFGPLDPDALSRIDSADPTTLRRFEARLLTANTLAEFFDDQP
ncbi:MAG: hypothetical protein DIU78_004050 [Pseudomonadota bacterium]